MATLSRKFDNEPEEKIQLSLGEIPVMVRSKFCNLHNMTETEMIKKHEDGHEFGGYFIINGNEKIIRMLVMNKKNYPIALVRPGFENRGKFFTKWAVMMRCQREDLFTQSVYIHYLSDGNSKMRFIYKKQEFLIPVYILLKAMADVTDA